MLGIQIGEVANFRLDQEKQVVMVEFRIKEGIKVYDDAIASIKTSGLIGDRYVSLDAGGGGLILKPGGVITQTESPPDLSDLIGKYAFAISEKKGRRRNDNDHEKIACRADHRSSRAHVLGGLYLRRYPSGDIKAQVDRALEVLRDPALKAESAKAEKEKKIWAILDSVFDYTELSKRTLAQNWKRLSPDQQKEFTSLFGNSWVRSTWTGSSHTKTKKWFLAKSPNLSDKTAEVQSEVKSAKPIPSTIE